MEVRPLLEKLVPTAECIPSTSKAFFQFIANNESKADLAAQHWEESIRSVERRDKVQFLNAMVFLANDLVLTDRLKKLTDGSLVHRAFERVMPQAISGFVEVGTPETVETLKRVLGIWKSKRIYEGKFIEKLMGLLSRGGKQLPAQLVEVYSGLVELKRGGQDLELMRDLEKYVEAKKAVMSLKEKRESTKEQCGELVGRLEHAEMTEQEVKNLKIEAECSCAELERVLERERATLKELGDVMIRLQKRLLERHQKELGGLREGRAREAEVELI